MADDEQDARTALGTIPGLGLDPRTVGVTRLGGLTNRVFRIDAEGARFCLRLPGQGTEAYIDRAVEAQNARAAAAAGVSPAVVWFGPDGVMLTRFVDGAVTLTPELYRERPGAVERAGRALRRLHERAHGFAFRFELFAMIERYRALLAARGATLPEGYARTLAEAARVRAALERHPVALTACHCDPLCENFLDDGARAWIVDWEYSGNNDPMWDLGDLSVEAGFDRAMDERLLTAYFAGPAADFDRGRMVAYKAMCDLLWTLWGLIQHSDGNPAEDFWAYATGRLERCRALLADPDFARHLAAVAAGPKPG